MEHSLFYQFVLKSIDSATSGSELPVICPECGGRVEWSATLYDRSGDQMAFVTAQCKSCQSQTIADLAGPLPAWIVDPGASPPMTSV